MKITWSFAKDWRPDAIQIIEATALRVAGGNYAELGEIFLHVARN
jgi:hypothetical protein